MQYIKTALTFSNSGLQICCGRFRKWWLLRWGDDRLRRYWILCLLFFEATSLRLSASKHKFISLRLTFRFYMNIKDTPTEVGMLFIGSIFWKKYLLFDNKLFLIFYVVLYFYFQDIKFLHLPTYYFPLLSLQHIYG